MDDSKSRGGSGTSGADDDRDEAYSQLRRAMVLEQLVRRGIRDPRGTSRDAMFASICDRFHTFLKM